LSALEHFPEDFSKEVALPLSAVGGG